MAHLTEGFKPEFKKTKLRDFSQARPLRNTGWTPTNSGVICTIDRQDRAF